MKTTSATFALLVTLVVASYLPAQEPTAEYVTPQKEHEWLKQFEGEWVTDAKATFGPGQEPVECNGTMKSRMLGQFWVVSEVESGVQGMSINAIQTIGYDPQKKKYVGTWVDSMMNHLWKYEGTIDEATKTLTLEAEGPNFMLAGKMSTFRDSYQFKSADHIVATSSIQGEDGEWITFMTGNYRRKK
jgi:hypothetical protein